MHKTLLEQGLIGHWPFLRDCQDHSGMGLAVRNYGVRIGPEGPPGKLGAACFNGTDAFLEVEDHPALQLGTGDFSIAAWVYTGEASDVVGDLLSKFDASARRGFQLAIVSNAGMTSTAQSNYRHLHFGIDEGHLDAEWTDCGRPGKAVKITALRVAQGRLYAGTLETGPVEQGHLWRYEGGQEWTDLGNPVGCNAVQSVAEFDGALYVGLGRYMTPGSRLGEVLNPTPGGQMYRLDGDSQWVYCGHPGAEDAVPEGVPTTGYHSGKADDLMSLTVYQGHLYGVSNHRYGVFRYEGGEEWTYLGPEARILTLTPYRGDLYALINGGPVYRYAGGQEWVDCGRPGTSTQTYSAVIHYGQLYVGTWPQGEVYRYAGGAQWARVGSGPVGYEREIMGMALYNGKVYLGSLPMAHVWRMDGEDFTFIGNLDASPVPLRRVWTLAVYQGRLFAGTLPSGHVYSLEAGKMATWDEGFPGGWHHLAAVKEGGRLRLYLDGQRVAVSSGFYPEDFNLSIAAPLHIGFGPHEHFPGRMSDLRLYNRALGADEITELAQV